MASRSVLLGLLCAVATLHLAYAALPGPASMLITSMPAGGVVMYLTAGTDGSVKLKSVDQFDRFSTQHWIVTKSFPSGFNIQAQILLSKTTTLANGTKIVTQYYPLIGVVSGAVTLVQFTSGVTQATTVTWNFDTWGRLVTNDKKYLEVPKNTTTGLPRTNTKLTLTASTSPSSVFQQWVIQQDSTLTPGMNLTGLWRSVDGIAAGTAKQSCLDSGPASALVLGKANAPTLVACSTNVASQFWLAMPPNPLLDVPDSASFQIGFYPSLFRLYSATTGLCLGGTPPFGSGRTGSNLVQVRCDVIFADTTWFFNSHGQLENGARTTAGNPLCIGNMAGVPQLVDCSFKVFYNRWEFTY